MICRFGECDREVWNKLNECCQRHYTQLSRGKIPGMVKGHRDPDARFERMVNRSGGKDWLDDGKSELSAETTECWKWTGKLNQDGYAMIGIGGKQIGAHRFSYAKYIGPVPEGLLLDHLCRVRHCVNPDHLEAVTNEENIRRGGNAAKVICKYGHPLSGENLILTNQGTRQCRICVRRRAMEYYFRKTGRV